MNRNRSAFRTARMMYGVMGRFGVSPCTAMGRVTPRLMLLYPDIHPRRIREIATLALLH